MWARRCFKISVGTGGLVVLEAVAAREVAAARDHEVRDQRPIAVDGGLGDLAGNAEVFPLKRAAKARRAVHGLAWCEVYAER
jgi:hypothetical protein